MPAVKRDKAALSIVKSLTGPKQHFTKPQAVARALHEKLGNAGSPTVALDRKLFGSGFVGLKGDAPGWDAIFPTLSLVQITQELLDALLDDEVQRSGKWALGEDDMVEGVRRCLCMKFTKEALSPTIEHWSEP